MIAGDLTEEVLRELFVRHQDDDGNLGPRALKSLLIALGDKPSNQEIYMMIGDVDAEGKGSIDYAGLLTLMESKMKKT